MKTILHIDSSARKTDNPIHAYNSISKRLSAHFVEKWLSSNTEDTVIYRDIGLHPIPYIDQDWIAAVFTPIENLTDEQKCILALSDTLIEELVQADIIVISAPMYNYGMPAVLKSWFDQVVRINKTFTFDLARGDFPIKPILSDKKLVLITSSGEFGFERGGIREQMNHLGPHVQTASGYLGVEAFYEVRAEYQEFADARHDKSVKDAFIRLDELVAELS